MYSTVYVCGDEMKLSLATHATYDFKHKYNTIRAEDMALWNIIMSRSWLCFHCFAVDFHQCCENVMRPTTSISLSDINSPKHRY